eukprot:PhF_6_TR17000/c0_g1_i1/m.25736
MLNKTRSSLFSCCVQHLLSPTTPSSPETPCSDHIRPDTCFEVHSNTVKFGLGALREVGRDCVALGGGVQGGSVAVITDPTVASLPFFETVLTSLLKAKIPFRVYDKVRVEPTDGSFIDAARFVQEYNPTVILSVGGGSVMDTAKAANLFGKYPRDNFLDYVNVPVGKGMPSPGPLLPHIACPTTCGTGSECTPFAICDIVSMNCKSGISNHNITPTMAVVDPEACFTLPSPVIAASGFDVLSHSIESYTARPYHQRPQLFPGDASAQVKRPPFNGSNPYSDMACERAMRLLGRSYKRAVAERDTQAIQDMCLASMLAGTAMGNAGCHLPHAMSYPLSGLVTDAFKEPQGYPHHPGHPVLPHGYSVALGAPTTAKLIGKLVRNEDMKGRLQECVQCLAGANKANAIRGWDGGDVLADVLIDFMKHNQMPAGIQEIGFSENDIDKLVERCFVQKRLVGNAPLDVSTEHLGELYRGALKYW